MNLPARANAIPPTLIPLSPGKRPEILSSNPSTDPLKAVRSNASIISLYSYSGSLGETTPMKIKKARISMGPTASTLSGFAAIEAWNKESNIGKMTPLIEIAGNWAPVIAADTTPDFAGICTWSEPQVCITLNPMTTSAAEFFVDTPSVVDAFLPGSLLGDVLAVPIAEPNPSPAWLADLTLRIRRFSSLQSNWDSYGGKPISPLAIERAVTIASRLAAIVSRERTTLTDKPFAAPTSSGGVLFEISNGGRELQIEIGPEKEERYRIYRSDEREEYVGDSGLSEVLSWIVRIR